MKLRNIIAAALAAAFLPLSAAAEIALPSVIADNMVLQRDSEVNLWGKATPGKTVTVRTGWNGKKYSTTAATDSTWRVSVATGAAGGPYEVKISQGKDEVKLGNVLLGEVWLCSGQSNMEMPMRGFDRQPLVGTNDIIARAKESTPVRMFITDSDNGRWVRQFSDKPQDDMFGRWLTNTPENVALTSAVAYYFARYINDVLDVPVGILVTTLGGSRIEPWMSVETLAEFPEVSLEKLNPTDVRNNTPAALYNAKLHPLMPFGFRGTLWYQGESNRDNANRYAAMMEAFARQLRAESGNQQMPFYFVEIAPYDYEGADDLSAAYLREAQADALDLIPNSGIASTLDVGNYNFIHPVDKATVGDRLAWIALANTYGMKGFGWESPRYKSHEVIDGKIYINVTGADRGLCPMWTSLEGFEIAGEDGVFHPAFAEVETKTCRLAVSSPEVPAPVHVRYAFHNTPKYSVYNIHGLPLLPFRTDK